MSEQIWRVLAVIKWSANYFQEKKIEQPRLNAEILLAHILHCKRLDLYLQFDRPLTVEERGGYRELIRRRGNGEPWQYLTGETDFYGLTMGVDTNVLIPRPETEILVEKTLARLDSANPLTIWDIGTGSGAIAISLAKNLPYASIIASDVSPAALAVARENAHRHGTEAQIQFLHSDLDAQMNGHIFDVIISNPPYVATAQLKALAPEVRREPETALNGGIDGLDYYRRIAPLAGRYLKNQGLLALEIGADQGLPVKIILESIKELNQIEIHPDYARFDRIVFAKRGDNNGFAKND